MSARPARSGFFEAVYELVRQIPRGRVATYGQVAAWLGVPRGARAVGWALRALAPQSSPRVPWHRVLGRGGQITLRGGSGAAEQRRRLAAEHVQVVGLRVDLARHGLGATPPLSKT